MGKEEAKLACQSKLLSAWQLLNLLMVLTAFRAHPQLTSFFTSCHTTSLNVGPIDNL